MTYIYEISTEFLTLLRKNIIQSIRDILDLKSLILTYCLNKIFKVSLIHTELNKQQTTELKNLLNINKYCKVKTIHHQVQVEEVLTIKDVNRKIKQCKNNEAEKEKDKKQ
ncbi:uncharacterized protein PADG_11215 [Paracoccidioides brasiliensis Pb18]|uniref:Uncharacterized protein n=1 Tax=Paracoccidioides brasiliensis (strain Pb18) TaxID=502780 RepID=A0A0A0HW33_PARBD|nr:uncharacterized protein PADG_11215 [Paracoccidioides brasiliensis Pb18]KGM92757.1 hypothetical protein PADG_11215 [Paracoccidioides brasiliensis Pb18]